MSKQNKITSYFGCSSLKVRSHSFQKKVTSDVLIKKTVSNNDDDCIIIDDVELSESIDIIENELNIDDNVENEEQNNTFGSQDDKNDNTISSDDDDILFKSLVEIESQGELEKKTNHTDLDTPTIFFVTMIEEFLDREQLHYLLDVSDLDLIKKFHDLPKVEYKILFVRLYWLQWKWYKAADLVLKYLKCDLKNSTFCQIIIKTLIENNFLLSGIEEMDFEDWSSVLLKPDLVKICNHFKLDATNSDKNMLIARLRKFCNTKSTIFNHTKGSNTSMEKNVLKMISENFGECIKITDKSKRTFDSLHLISYIGMNPAILHDKKLNLLLMNIRNGKETFPAMNIELDSLECAFPSIKLFNEYAEAHDLYEQILKFTTNPPCEHQEVIKIARQCLKNYKKLYILNEKPWIPSVWLHRFTSGYCYIKSLENSIGSYKALKNNKYLNEALDILSIMLQQNYFRQHKRALWYNEKALILQTRLKDVVKTAQLLIVALNESDISKDAKAPLVDRARRLANQKNIKLPKDITTNLLQLTEEPEVNFPYIEIAAKTTDNNFPGRKSQYMFRDIITGDRMYSNVEQYALLHYINNTEYNNGEHWEGRIVNSIFILLFWDIIYSPIDSASGVFLSKYQEAPLDIYTDKFYSNRKTSITARITQIESGWSSIDDIIEFMHDIYLSRKEGEVSLFHSGIEWSQISEIVQCLGRNGLLCLCKRLSMSYYYAQSGFPDLTIWNINLKKLKFVEVKGDGDRLSHKQIQWMNYLIENGIDAEVCYVHKGSNLRKSPKKRKSKNENKEKLSSNEEKKNEKLTVVEDECVNIIGAVKKRQRRKVTQNESPIKNKPLSQSSTSKAESSPKNDSLIGDVYLRSPTKHSKGGIGYFVSPQKEPISRRKLSLSLTKRKLYERDT